MFIIIQVSTHTILARSILIQARQCIVSTVTIPTCPATMFHNFDMRGGTSTQYTQRFPHAL